MSGSCFKLHGGLLFIHEWECPSPKEVPWNARQALVILKQPQNCTETAGGLAGALGPQPCPEAAGTAAGNERAGQRPGTFS